MKSAISGNKEVELPTTDNFPEYPVLTITIRGLEITALSNHVAGELVKYLAECEILNVVYANNYKSTVYYRTPLNLELHTKSSKQIVANKEAAERWKEETDKPAEENTKTEGVESNES